ncbi:MAG: hypothetical protein MUE79_02740 [Nitratireductor sp.]|nr:hypothetical protein [Nitratireductor sp.]
MNHADAFRWISVALSMVLGLGVARLLTALVAQFHARRHRTADWLPLAWAAIIFVHQIAFWWGIEELAGMQAHRWTAASFTLLLSLVLSLFLAAALVLPFTDTENVTSLRQFFSQDGKWSLLVLAAYNALAMATNLFIFGAGDTPAEIAPNLALLALALAGFFLPRRQQAMATAAYAAMMAAGMAAMLPAAY